MDASVVVLFVAILIVAVLLLVVIAVTRKGPKELDVDKYRVRWLQIEQQLARENPNTYQMTILEADKLLDMALKERGVKGDTMGERMKAELSTWSNANAVWSAHKLRNQIAHEPGFTVAYDDVRRALGAFKQALKDEGAI